MRVFICHRIVFIWWTSVDALEVFIWTFFRHYFWIFRTLFNCFKIIIYAAYSVPLCLNALRHLALYLEDRNDISDKVQTMNSDCCLMELIYSFFFSFLPFFFFGFVCVFQGNLNRNHMFCACIPEATLPLLVGALNFSDLVRGKDDADSLM